MSDDMSDVFNNIKNMIDNGNLPDDIQEIVNNFKNSEYGSNNQNTNNDNKTSENFQDNTKNSQASSNSSVSNNSNNLNFDTSKISPEMIKNLSNLLNSNSNQSNTNTNNDNKSEPSIDINTILKMKTIIDSMNQKNDPRANLLYSLKPYLRENRKNKLDQYVNLLKMTKIADVMKSEKKENNTNA